MAVGQIIVCQKVDFRRKKHTKSRKVHLCIILITCMVFKHCMNNIHTYSYNFLLQIKNHIVCKTMVHVYGSCKVMLEL